MSEWNTYIQSGMSFHWSASFCESVVSCATVILKYLRLAQAADEAKVHEAKVHWQWALNGSIAKQQTLRQNRLIQNCLISLRTLRHFVTSLQCHEWDRSCLVNIDGCIWKWKITLICMVHSFINLFASCCCMNESVSTCMKSCFMLDYSCQTTVPTLHFVLRSTLNPMV